MFVQNINNHPFLSEEAEAFFPIHGDSWNGDGSFVATLRALIYPRMQKGDTINFRHRFLSGLDFKSAHNECQSKVADLVLRRNFDPEVNDTITLINLAGCAMQQEVKDAVFEDLKQELPKRLPGYNRHEGLTVLFKNSFPFLCFLSGDHRSVLIVSYLAGLRAWHSAQCAIPAYLPWYFKEKMTEAEFNFVNTLEEKLPDKYLAELDARAIEYNFDEMRVRRLLDGFETRYVRSEIRAVESDIESKRANFERAQRQIQELLKAIDDLQIRLWGLHEKSKHQSEGMSDIQRYFLRNRALELINCDESNLQFAVYTYCQYFNPDEAKRVIENMDSVVYDECQIDHENFSKLMRAIFLDQTVRLRFYAEYMFDLRGSVRGLENNNPTRSGYMANPHILGYACLGENQGAVNELLRQSRYIPAIDQCIASAGGLSFTDYTVMSDFARKLSSSSRPCIELPDGTVVRVKEAIEFLKQ